MDVLRAERETCSSGNSSEQDSWDREQTAESIAEELRLRSELRLEEKLERARKPRTEL